MAEKSFLSYFGEIFSKASESILLSFGANLFTVFLALFTLVVGLVFHYKIFGKSPAGEEMKPIISFGLAGSIGLVMLFCYQLLIITPYETSIEKDKKHHREIVKLKKERDDIKKRLAEIDSETNKEKEEVKRLVKKAFIDIDLFAKDQKYFLNEIKMLKGKNDSLHIKKLLNNIPLIMPENLNNLITNKLFSECCFVSYRGLLNIKQEIDKLMSGFRSTDFNIDSRSANLNTAYKLTTIVKQQLILILRFIDGEINEADYIKIHDQMTDDYLPKECYKN